MDDWYSRLVRCFSAVFPELGEEEIPESNVSSVERWESMASVTLFTVLEEEFGIEIKPEHIEDLISFGIVWEYLKADGNLP